MAKKAKIRLTLTMKLLILFLSVLIVTNFTIREVSYKETTSGMTSSVYTQMDAVSNDVVNQIKAINDKNFQTLHVVAELAMIKDENVSMEAKQKEIVNVISAISDNCIDMAFYDANGDALLADGRRINFANRPYFQEAFAGKDYISDPKFSTVTNSILQHLSVPVHNAAGKTIGVVVMVIEGNTILSTIEGIDMGGGMHPSVINWASKSTVANVNAGTDESTNGTDGEELDENEGLGLILNNIFAGKEGIDVFEDPNIHAHLIASYKKVPDTTWTVFAVAPYDHYFGDLETIQRILTIVSIFTIVLSGILIIILVRLLIKPLKVVKNSIETIASQLNDLMLDDNNFYEIYLVGNRNFEIDLYSLKKLVVINNIIKVKDETKLAINLDEISKDNTLKGLFVREILSRMNDENYDKETLEKALEIGLEILEK